MPRNPDIARLEELLKTNRDAERILQIGVDERRPAEWTRGQIEFNFGLTLSVYETVKFMQRWQERRAELERIEQGDGGAPGKAIVRRPEEAAGAERVLVAEPVSLGPAPPAGVLAQEVLSWSLGKVRDLLAEAKEDPECDAAKIIRIVLLNATVANQLKLNETEVHRVYAEQTRTGELERKVKRLDIDRYNAETKAKAVEARRLDMEFKQRQALAKVKQAKDAVAQGKPFDAAKALDQLSDIIGLSGPPERRVEQ